MFKRTRVRVTNNSRFNRVNLSVFGVLFAFVGGYLVISSFAATTPPTTANLWVDANGGNCVRSNSPVAYSDADACSSIDAAWDKCLNASSDTVVIKPFTGGGSYPAQSITGSKTGSGCKTIGEDGTNIGVLNISADYFSLENVTVIAPSTHGSGGLNVSANNVTLKNVNLHGPYVSVDIGGVSNLLWQGGELGEAGKVGGKRVVCPAGGGSGDPEPVQINGTTNVTFDGIRFHPQDADLTPVSCSSNGFHLEMIRIEGGNDYFTIRNSTFDSGDHSGTASIFITTSSPGGSAANHLLFENNFFGDVDASSGAFSVHSNVSTCSNYTFAYNTFLSSTGAFQCANMVNNKWVGNLASNFFDAAKPCPAITSVIYTNNVWQDDYINYSGNKNCGTDGVTPGFGGTNPGADTLVQGTRYSTNALGLGGADGFHLQAGSKAIDKGEAGGYCASTLGSRDHDGSVRPFGTRCDAGAHEYGASAPPTGPTANLWVSTAAGSSPSKCDTACPYDATKAYGSFNAAYQAALPGQTIYIKGGTYPAQTVAVQASKVSAASDVSFQVAPGETATVNGDLKIYGSHLIIKGESLANKSLKIPNNTVFVNQVGGAETGANRTNHVTVQWVDGANFQIGPAAYVTLDANDWGPSTACNSNYPSVQTEDQISWDGSFPGVVPDHITLSNNTIHHMNTDDHVGCHMGGLVVTGFNYLTISGNKFYGNAIYDIEIDEFTGTQAIDHLTIENNWFGAPVGTNDGANGTNKLYGDNSQADVQVKWNGHAGTDWLIRYNSFSQGFSPEWGGPPSSYTNFRVIGNIGGTIVNGGWQFCAPFGKTGVTYAYNVVRGLYNGTNPGGNPACGGAGAVNLGAQSYAGNEYNLSSLPYTSAATTNPDYHLSGAAGSTQAENIVTYTTSDYALTTDIDGNIRTAPRDAGADERTGGTPTPKPGDTNNDNLVNIIDLSTLLSHWNTNYSAADFNKDNTVNVFDLSILLSNYGK